MKNLMDKVSSAEDALEVISEETKTRTVKSVRVIRELPVGKAFRQGDVYVFRVPDNHPKGAMRQGDGARQVAVGVTTGARHYACHPAVVYEGVTLPLRDMFQEMQRTYYPRVAFDDYEKALLGPVIEAEEPWTLEHPEHANDRVLEVGRFQVVYQIDPRTMKRRAD